MLRLAHSIRSKTCRASILAICQLKLRRLAVLRRLESESFTEFCVRSRWTGRFVEAFEALVYWTVPPAVGNTPVGVGGAVYLLWSTAFSALFSFFSNGRCSRPLPEGKCGTPNLSWTNSEKDSPRGGAGTFCLTLKTYLQGPGLASHGETWSADSAVTNACSRDKVCIHRDAA